MDLKNKKVTIIGAARSGIAAANLVLSLGGQPRISDAKPRKDFEATLNGLSDPSRVVIEDNGHTKDMICSSDLVVASPGVPRDAQPLEWARAAGIPVWGEIELAWRACRKPVIAVTGSNGKTTTVTLISKVIAASGKKVCLCGNVGQPFSQFATGDFDYFVVEISSFQLELIETFKPYIAAILNFSQNHLDRHPDMQDYLSAKKRIFLNQTKSDFALLNAQDGILTKMAPELKATVRFFNDGKTPRNPNQLAALEVARILGIPDAIAFEVFDNFKGVEHRIESVRTINGVEFINDSKSTTVEAGRWALTQVKGPVILIAGGHDKGMDYSVLRELVGKTVKKMIVLTREEQSRVSLHKSFDGVVPIEDQTDMREAIVSAQRQSRPGEKVLLSPMFASFDMFKNFEERGKVFKEIVNSL